MRAKHAFALKTDLLGDALGRDVVGIGDEIETLELEVLERVTREQAQRPRANSPTARRGGHPVPESSTVVGVQADPDTSHHAPVELDRQSLLLGKNLARV